MTHDQLVRACGTCEDLDLEIVYVNDGSSDRTEEILDELLERDKRVTVVSLTRNFGHQAAVTAGLAHATGDAVVVIDADLQDPPEVILQMVAKWREGYHVVYGVRTRRKEGLTKRLLYSAFYRLYRRLANIEVPLDSGDFALLDRRVVDALNSLPEKNRFVRGLRSWAGFRQVGLTYERSTRVAGEPKYGFIGLVKLAFDGIFNFTTVPLTLIFVAGLGVAGFAAAAAVFYFVARILNIGVFTGAADDAPGFTTLILAILFFSGVQLVSIGILGEYLGRIYEETKARPPYLVRSVRADGGTPSRHGEDAVVAAGSASDEPRGDGYSG